MTIDERRTTPIKLPGIHDADCYQFAFKTLPQWEVTRLAGRRRVFHGPLRYTGKVGDNTDGSTLIELYAGDWDSTARQFTRPWTLVFPGSTLTTRQREDLGDEFDSVARSARDQNVAFRVFGLATQDTDTQNHLIVSSRTHITFMPSSAE